MAKGKQQPGKRPGKRSVLWRKGLMLWMTARAAGILFSFMVPAMTVATLTMPASATAATAAAAETPAGSAGLAPTLPAGLAGPRSTDLKAAFEAMYRDPGNLDKTFRYAELAARSGDFEGAVSALERMLLFNPNLPRVRLELGVLYFRLGSFEAARSYFRDVLMVPAAPADVRERVKTYMDEIERRTSDHHFSGSLTVGSRYQTNANSGTSAGRVWVGNTALFPSDDYTQKADANLFAALSLTHTYDFKTEPVTLWESTLQLFGARQRDQFGLNTQALDVRSGPRFTLEQAVFSDLRLSPFLDVGHIRLGNEPYLSYFGGGLSLKTGVTETIGFEIEGLHRQMRYRNSPDHRDATDRDGGDTRLTAALLYEPTEATRLTVSLEGGRELARQEHLKNWEAGINAAFQMSYPPPLNLTTQSWISGVGAGISRTRYDEPNAALSRTITREDDEWRLNAMTVVPVRDDLALILMAQRSRVESTLSNFTNSDTLVSVSGSWRF